MMKLEYVVYLVGASIAGYFAYLWSQRIWSVIDKKYYAPKRREYINHFKFPSALEDKIKEEYPYLNSEAIDLVLEGLRRFFLVSSYAAGEPIAMPSKVVDYAWHQFILFTMEYERFCTQAFGNFYHHYPAAKTAEIKGTKNVPSDLKRVWYFSCMMEEIDLKEPHKLPLLFALDADLGIEAGNNYTLHADNAENQESSGLPVVWGCMGGCGGGGGGSGCSGGGGCSGN